MAVSFYESLESRAIWPELPLLVCISLYPGFPGALRERCRCDPWVRKIPWRRAWQPSPVFQNPLDRGVWQVTVQGAGKNQT